MARTTRGILIVVEGVDRSGKSTQCKNLQQTLQAEHNIVSMRFPDRTTSIGSMIDQYLKNSCDLSDESIHLLYSANRWEKKKIIEEHLDKGTSIICDRYAYSGAAFSMAKGMDMEWCQNPDKGLPRPDLLLFLQLSSEAASQRPGFGDERYEESAFQLKVRAAYSKLEKEEQNSISWTYINAEQSEQQVFEEMKKHILLAITEKQNDPKYQLWKK